MAHKTIAINAHLDQQFTITSDIRGHQMVIDQPKNAGGQDAGPTPLEYFLFSLAGCIGSIARIIAMQRKLPVRTMDISVTGDMDPAGLLGKPTDSRVGFESLNIQVSMDADMSDAEKLAFLEEVNARCPVSENIAHLTPIIKTVS